ncbi:zinc finger, CCHC-type containing protein [Tanacetum coccineum]
MSSTSHGRLRILDSKCCSFIPNKWYQELGSTGVRLSSAIKFWAARRVLGLGFFQNWLFDTRLSLRFRFIPQKVSGLLEACVAKTQVSKGVMVACSTQSFTYWKRVLELFLFVEVIDMGKRKFKDDILSQREMGARYNHKKSQGFVRNEDQVSNLGADGYDNVDVMMAIKYDGDNIMLIDGRESRVRGIGKVQVQMMDGPSFVLDNVRSVSFSESSGLSKDFWAEYTTMSTYLMNRSPLSAIGFKTPEDMLDDVTSKVVLNRNMSFNESGEYNKTFIGYGVDTGSAQVLQGVEFEVEPQEAHTFEVEPHVNFDHVAVAAVEKIYAHESLTFNNTVTCEQPVTTAMAITGSIHQISYHLEVQEYKDLLVASAKKRYFRNDVKVTTRLRVGFHPPSSSQQGDEGGSTSHGRLRILDSKVVARYSNKWYQELGFEGSLDSRSTGVRLSSAIKFWAARRVLGLGFFQNWLFDTRLSLRFRFIPQKVSGLLEACVAKTQGYSSNGLFLENSQKALTYLGDRVLPEITKEKTATEIWKKLETLYMRKSLANRLYLKKKLYTFHMHPGKSQSEHIDEFHKLVGDLVAIDTAISDEDQAELQKMTEAKGDGGEGLYVRRISSQRDMEQGTYSAWSKSHGKSSRLRCYICESKEHLKRDCPRYNHKKSQGFVRNEDQIMDSGGSNHLAYRSDYLFDFEEYDGDNIMFIDGRESRVRGIGTRRANCIYTLDGQCMKSGVVKHLGVPVIQQQNGLVKETNMTLLAKVVLNRNMSFNESGEYNKTFIGYGVDTGSAQVLQGVEFEVEPQEAHTFEVEPHVNFDHVAVAAVEKIYAHESLTFNNTVTCEQPVTTAMAITGSIHQFGFYNEKLVQTLLEGHFILSLEGSLSGDCDVEKNSKWSCIYAVGSQEYQVVCTRPDIASADVDRSLSWVDQSQAAYMTLMEAAKEAIWLKGLAIESGFELNIVAGIATGALSKAIPGTSHGRFRILDSKVVGRYSNMYESQCQMVGLVF